MSVDNQVNETEMVLRWMKENDTCKRETNLLRAVMSLQQFPQVFEKYVDDFLSQPGNIVLNKHEQSKYSDFECDICNIVCFQSGQHTTCGSSFCQNCIIKWFENNQSCPCCRDKCQLPCKACKMERLVIPNNSCVTCVQCIPFVHNVSNATRKHLEKVQILCPNQTCDQTFTFSGLKSHLVNECKSICEKCQVQLINSEMSKHDCKMDD